MGVPAPMRRVPLLAALLVCLIAEALPASAASWTTAPSMAEARETFAAAMLPDGRVLLTGGKNAGTVSSTEIYDPVRNTVTSAGSLTTGRWRHTATLLRDGRVLVAGGATTGDVPVASVEIYDPSTGLWSAGPPLATARQLHRATVLPDGRVLVSGGLGGSGVALMSAELFDPGSNSWSSAGSMVYARQVHAATLLPSGKVLVAGGSTTSSSTATCELYDPALNSWTLTGSLNVGRYEHVAVLMASGKVLTAGGYNTGSLYLSSAEIYDPSTGVWTTTGSLTTTRMLFAGVLLPDGRVLVNGGYNAGTAHASAEIFNPSSGTWSSGGSMSSGRLAQEMVVLLNGKVLVAGGASLAPAYSASLDIFDPNVGVWTSAGAMSGARTAVTTVPLPNGKVLAVGGQSGAVIKVVAELYDPALNSWSLANPMATPRMSPGSALLSDGRVLMAAGQDNTGPDTVMNKSEIYDPVSGNWTPTGDMGAARYNFPMVLLPNDKVLAAGGANIGDSFSASELYDPAAGSWSPTGSMSVKRYRHSLTILPDGKVLAVGGRNTASLASCELYDPVTGTWTVTGSMATPRYDHTATLLFNGKVLVTGGYQTPATYLQSAELYDPAAGTWSAAAALGVTRIAHSAALLPSGKVLVSGGYNAGQTHATSVVYDPVKNAWAVGPTLLAARNGQSMAALPDGGVLLVGGSDFVGPLASAEKAFFSEYDQRLVPAFRPVIASVNGSSSFPVVVSTTGRNTVYGSTFTGRSWQGVEPPRVTLRAALAGDWGSTLASPRVVDLSSTVFEASWSSGDLSFRIPAGVPPGYYQLRVHAGAFLSDAKLVRLPSADFAAGTVAAAGFADVSSGSLVVRWGATVRSGTEFHVQLSTFSDFSVILASTDTYDTRAPFTGLTPSKTYHARLRAGTSGTYVGLSSTRTAVVLPSGCFSGFDVRKDGASDFTTIQAALDALPRALSTTTCVVLRDTQTYVEAVVVAGFTNNAYRLKIMGDPSFTSTAPVVTPPGASFAGFDVRRASVTLANLKVLSPDNEMYGVRATSPSLLVSSVGVRIAENLITHSGADIASGVLLSSSSEISDSDIYAKFMDAIHLSGGGSLVLRSTATGVASQRVAVRMTANSGSVVSDSWFVGRIQFDNGTQGNQVLRSTVNGGVVVAYSSSTVLKDLYVHQIWSWPGVWVLYSTATRIESSVIVSTQPPAVSVSSGNVGFTMLSSSLLGAGIPDTGVRLDLGTLNTGIVSVSSCAIQPSSRGIDVSAQASGFQLQLSSITFSLPTAAGATGIRFLSGTFVSTISLTSFSDAGITTNVDGSALGAASRITMMSATGVGAGPVFESDPLGVVDWPNYAITPAAFVGLSSYSLTAQWTTTFPEGTLYYAQLSTVSDFTSIGFSSNTLGLSAAFTTLDAQTTYYARVAYAPGGPFTLLGATRTLSVPPSQAGAPTPTVLGVSSISWTWTLLPGATGYDVFQASSGVLLANVAAPPYIQQGLLPNATHGLVLRGQNISGPGPLSPSATAWTLASPPTGLGAAVYITSAALHWGWNSNPAWTIAQLERSTDSTAFTERFGGAATTYLDSSLQECSTYQYRVRYRNLAGESTAYDAYLQFVTSGTLPTAPGGFTADSLAGRIIRLSWEPSPSLSVLEYRLYWDNGTGTVDYGSPLAVLSSTVTSFTTGSLVDGTVYRFGLRAYNHCAVEDTNTRVAAQAVAMESLTGVKAAIKVPQSGKRIKGNRVTVMAELTLGSESGTKQVLFQYRAAGGIAWTSIVAANANHPNPDLEAPYFVHWDVTGLANGDYELRAQATDVYAAVDSSPAIITISVTNDPVEFDISETSQGGGKVKKEQVVYQSVANTVQAADEGTAQTTKVLIPADALSASTVAVAVTNNPAALPALPTGIESAGASVEITLSNGQSQLSSGKTATVTLSYKDDDDNGIVDGTTCRADRLVVYAHDTAGGEWRKEGAASVDRTAKTVSAPTPHFSFFALVVPTSSDLSALRIYPSPFRPNNDSADDGVPYNPSDANSGIIFENLPNGSKIRVYTVTGQLVARFDAGTSGKVQWDASNDDGGQVASGVYLAVVSAPGQKEVVRKIAIIR